MEIFDRRDNKRLAQGFITKVEINELGPYIIYLDEGYVIEFSESERTQLLEGLKR